MTYHPTQIGQIVKFIQHGGIRYYPENALFLITNFYIDLDGDAIVNIKPFANIPSDIASNISTTVGRFANRFQVVTQRISYTKDIHGTIHNRPTPRPVSSNERDRTSESLSPRGISMDSFADGFVSCESTPLRELSIDSISSTSRLREATSQVSGPPIRQDFFQWARGSIDNVSNRRIEIPRPNHATETRRLEGNQSARYQRNATTRYPIYPNVQESRPYWAYLLWREGATMGLPGETFRFTDYFTNSYSNYFSRASLFEEVDVRLPASRGF